MATLTLQGAEELARATIGTGSGGISGFLAPAPTSNTSSGETVMTVPPPRIVPPSLGGGGITLITPPPDIAVQTPGAPPLPSASPCSTCKESPGAMPVGAPRPPVSLGVARPLAGLPAMQSPASSETETLATVTLAAILQAQPWWLWVLLGFVAVKAFGRSA